MERRLLDLNHLASRRGQLPQLRIHGLGHVPRQLLLVIQVVGVGVAVEEEGEHLSGAGAELHGFPRRGTLLRDPPDLGVLERVLRVVLDLVDDARPAPRLVDRIEHGADGVGEER
jgi:hypothetical protein